MCIFFKTGSNALAKYGQCDSPCATHMKSLSHLYGQVYKKIHDGQYFIGDGFSNLIRGFIVGGTSVCRMSKLASIKFASIDMQIWTETCVVVLKRTVSMRGFFRAPQHMLTLRRLEKNAPENVVCSCRLLHTFAGTFD